MKYKVCPNCGKKKLLNKKNFCLSKNTPSGFHGWCKSCVRKYNRNWRAKNLEKARARDRRWRAKNPERIRASRRRFRIRNLEKVRAKDRSKYAQNPKKFIIRAKRWHIRNPEKVKTIHERWCAKNPEKLKAQKKKWRTTHPEQTRKLRNNYRARFSGAKGRLSRINFKSLLKKQKNKCYYCKKKITWPHPETHIEHKIPLSRGGSNYLRNIALSCRSCNCKKGQLTSAEFIKRLESEARNHRVRN